MKKKTKKTRVFSNLAISVDGKIATVSREFFGIGSPKDIRLLRALRSEADAIVYGAEVLRAFRKACLPLKKDHLLVNAVLSRKLDGVDPKWPFFSDARIRRILYVTQSVPASRRGAFEKTSILVKIPGKNPAAEILADLEKRGLRRVGVEGGGAVMWEFVKESRIDEYYVTVVPRLLGGDKAPTLVDGKGFTPEEALNLKLKRVKKAGSEIFLVYTPHRQRGVRHPEF